MNYSLLGGFGKLAFRVHLLIHLIHASVRVVLVHLYYLLIQFVKITGPYNYRFFEAYRAEDLDFADIFTTV